MFTLSFIQRTPVYFGDVALLEKVSEEVTINKQMMLAFAYCSKTEPRLSAPDFFKLGISVIEYRQGYMNQVDQLPSEYHDGHKDQVDLFPSVIEYQQGDMYQLDQFLSVMEDQQADVSITTIPNHVKNEVGHHRTKKVAH